MFSTGKILFYLSTCFYLVYGNEEAALQVMLSGLKQYDAQTLPNPNGPVNVGVTMYILNFNSFSDKKMELSVDMYFRQYWMDPRLAFYKHPELRVESVNGVPYESIWTPDSFFATARDVEIHDVMQRNTFTRVSATGDVLHSNRLTVVLNCPRNYRMFPFDTQVCTMDIESFGYKANQIYYEWHKGKGSVGINSYEVITRPEFKVMGHRLKSPLIKLATGNYSRLAVDFAISRCAASYILKIFFPATLVVILSWLGFWINPAHKTSRIFLGIVSTLILVDIFINETDSIPNTSYVKVVDVYLIACLLTVALSLVESVMVFYSTESEENSDEAEMVVQSINIKKLMGVCSKCDKYSRIAFPVTFICFFLIYWITVIAMSNFNVKENDFIPFDEY